MTDKIFWNQQEKLRDFKENKVKILFLASLCTFVPFGLIYGLFYEKGLRRVPFSFQLMTAALVFLMNKNIILQGRSYKRRVLFYYQQNILNN